jgi:formiminotetrahydrofolate cyclodeaminase
MREKMVDLSVPRFLHEVASGRPVPGGGSAAALTGSLAASLVSMVCRLTIGKKGYETVEKEMKKILKRSDSARKKLLDLVDADADSYRHVIISHKSSDAKLIQASLKDATRVPLKTALISSEVFMDAHLVYLQGKKAASCDARVAAVLAKASMRGALENVKANLKEIRDTKFQKRVEEKLKQLCER